MAEKKHGRNVGITETDDYISIDDLQALHNNTGVSPINLDYYGSEKCLPGYSFGPYVRSCYVLHMVLDGKGELRKNNTVYPVEKGQAFLIFPGETTVYQADRKNPWHYMWIGFHGYQAGEMIERTGFSPDIPVLSSKNMESIRGVMEEILNVRDLTYVNDLKRMSGLYALMALLTENGEGIHRIIHKGTDSEAEYVQEAIRLLTSCYQNKIKVADVAKQIGISRSYLTSIFKKEMKVSPQEFLMNFRMEKAGSLLTETKSPINVIAMEVGYSDSLSFSKAFRSRYGMSPSEFREKRPSLIYRNERGTYEIEYPL